MEASFWLERWANNEIGWHESAFNPLLTAHFGKLQVAAGGRVFVPLCGKTRDIAWLLQQGYRVAGAELSEAAVRQLFGELGVPPAVTDAGALKRYSAKGLDVFVGDLFELSSEHLGAVDAIYDRAALVALPPMMQQRYAQQLMTLTQKAPQLLICFEYDQRVMPGPPHSVTAADVWRHYGGAYRVTLAAVQAVAGGLKGVTPANELVWLLQSQ